jgi:hypothetical protein
MHGVMLAKARRVCVCVCVCVAHARAHKRSSVTCMECHSKTFFSFRCVCIHLFTLATHTHHTHTLLEAAADSTVEASAGRLPPLLPPALPRIHPSSVMLRVSGQTQKREAEFPYFVFRKMTVQMMGCVISLMCSVSSGCMRVHTSDRQESSLHTCTTQARWHVVRQQREQAASGCEPVNEAVCMDLRQTADTRARQTASR